MIPAPLTTQAPAGATRRELVEYVGDGAVADVTIAGRPVTVAKHGRILVGEDQARGLIAGGDFAPVYAKEGGR